MQIKNSNIYIVMYHYVRRVRKSKYQNLKALEFDEFKRQIDFFLNNFNILNVEDFIQILKTKKIKKKPSILLTFDDGYKDHYNFVFKYLKKKKISGCFYPPASVIENNKILDVNKIHFLLEKKIDLDKLFEVSSKALDKKFGFSLNKFLSINNSKIKKLKNRYDNHKIVVFKSLIQKLLPKNMRNFLITFLFERYVTKNIKEFSQELYLSECNIKEMISEGMHFGSHGYRHEWWEYLDKRKQKTEINKSIKFLTKVGMKKDNLSVCYPYGSYNKSTIDIVKQPFQFGLTTIQNSINKNNIKNKFILPRYDTNIFKKIS